MALKMGVAKKIIRRVGMLCVADTPRYRGMVSELDCWMEWIENSLADSAFDQPTADDFEEFIGGECGCLEIIWGVWGPSLGCLGVLFGVLVSPWSVRVPSGVLGPPWGV